MTRKRFLGLAVMIFTIFCSRSILSALEDYNRPKPSMDYVPQEIGIYDTIYSELSEADCRSCHGNSVADRHHVTQTVTVESNCLRCHQRSSTGVVVERNCTTSGCHSASENDLLANGWHHNTNASGSAKCVTCHSPNLISEIKPVRDLSLYPPSIVTPTPFSCENCHWEQEVVSGGDPRNPGHPSTFDHLDGEGRNVGYHEFGKKIYGNMDTHHMGFSGNVGSECYQCHAQDPYSPSWNPDDPMLIRYCERCHSIETLHNIGPHVDHTNGWEAAGLHVGGSTSDANPVRYREFTANEQCLGCHATYIDEVAPISPTLSPEIEMDETGIQPAHGTCGAIVTLRGKNFGEERGKGYSVKLLIESQYSSHWIDMPIYSWADTLIEFEIPCWNLLPKANYKIKVVTPIGESNERIFTMEDLPPACKIEPSSGLFGSWTKISGINFGVNQTEIFSDGYHGVYRIVDFVSSQGTYTACNYRNWTDSSFEVRFYDFFKDDIDPSTGNRNFILDHGELSVSNAEDMAMGKWAIYVNAIYFGDNNGNGVYDSGDTIFQVVAANPLYFDVSKRQIVYTVSPSQIENNRLINISGINFGSFRSGGEVRIGSESEAKNPDPGKGILQGKVMSWSNTAIKFKGDIPTGYQGVKYLWVEKNRIKSNYVKVTVR